MGLFLWPLIILVVALLLILFVLIYPVGAVAPDHPHRVTAVHTRGLLVVAAILIALGAILQMVMSSGHLLHIG